MSGTEISWKFFATFLFLAALAFGGYSATVGEAQSACFVIVIVFGVLAGISFVFAVICSIWSTEF